MRDRIFHYARGNELPDWLSLGWIIVKPNAVMHHHEYNFVCEWLCDCKMVRPQ